jgi:DNA transposition AAA+ family ATPase
MSDAPGLAFVETKPYRLFREFCDACRRDRYIGLCYGPPGVGKTLSARHYTDWDRVEPADPYTGRSALRRGEVPGNGSVLYTATVVNSPGQIERDIAALRGKMTELVLQRLDGEEEPRIATARRRLEEERAHHRNQGNRLAGKTPQLRRAEEALSRAVLGLTERRRELGDPTGLIVIDEADRIKVAGLEQVRDIFDRGGVGVVLVGMPGLERRLARYPQLYSRIGFVHAFRPLTAEEVRELLGQRWRPPGVGLPEDLLRDDEGVAALIRVTGGNFRLLHRLLAQVGRILEINGLGVVTREVVEAAREVLVIGAA